MTLPLAEAVLADLHAHTSSVIEPTPPEALQYETTIVLIVEDNADMRAYLRTHLDELYHVEEAENGAVGLERAVALVPDLVLSDVMMPEMDGLALLAALKADARTSHVPVVLLTAKADIESKVAGLQTGADDYLAKPFDAEELWARVHNLIAQRRRLRETFSPQGFPFSLGATNLPSIETAFLEQTHQAVLEGMAAPTFDVEALAATLGMSRRQLYRKLKSLLGEQPGTLIRRMRLAQAAALLSEKQGSVKVIAFQVGFQSPSQFRSAFRAVYGVAPSAYAAPQDLP